MKTGTEVVGGTDARVYMKLYGESSTSQVLKLSGSFDRGDVDKTEVELPSLGRLMNKYLCGYLIGLLIILFLSNKIIGSVQKNSKL